MYSHYFLIACCDFTLLFFVEARLGKLSLDELDELEDDEDEAILLEYRRKRIAEMKAEAEASKFGEVCITSVSKEIVLTYDCKIIVPLSM